MKIITCLNNKFNSIAISVFSFYYLGTYFYIEKMIYLKAIEYAKNKDYNVLIIYKIRKRRFLSYIG